MDLFLTEAELQSTEIYAFCMCIATVCCRRVKHHTALFRYLAIIPIATLSEVMICNFLVSTDGALFFPGQEALP
jgi:hypothetical protein